MGIFAPLSPFLDGREKEMEGSSPYKKNYAGVVERNRGMAKRQLKMEEVKIDFTHLRKHANMLIRDESRTMLTLPKGIMENRRSFTITYRTLNMARKRISITTEEDIMKALEGLLKGIVFYTRIESLVLLKFDLRVRDWQLCENI